MKVILSRKGFDASNGGIVSPILEDRTMISFPIPSADTDTFDDLVCNGISYQKLLNDLNYSGTNHCHIDPDLERSRRKAQIEGWVPAFGQCGASAVYLKNAGVQPEDLFLFFGNFHCAEYKNGKYSYMKDTGCFYRDRDLQVIWGYLQVGEILTDPDQLKQLWWHPHAAEKYRCKTANVIFKAADRLSFNVSRPGAGILTFDQRRILTAEGCKKATWKLNEIYNPDHLIGCRRKNSAKDPARGIYYAGIWQELCLRESDKCSEWAKSMIM